MRVSVTWLGEGYGIEELLSEHAASPILVILIAGPMPLEADHEGLKNERIQNRDL
jgi:hypothetical protein